MNSLSSMFKLEIVFVCKGTIFFAFSQSLLCGILYTKRLVYC